MLKEFIEALSKQAILAAQPKFLRPEAEPEHIYALVTANGHEFKVANPKSRAHTVGSIDALLQAAKQLPRPTGSVADTHPVIWYHRTGIVCIFDDSTRRDLARFPLSLSPQVIQLDKLEKVEPWLTHADFIRLLKHTFAGCLGRCPNLLDIVRKIKFGTVQAGSSELTKSKVSIGKSLEAELTGTGELPDYITLTVPVFAQGSVLVTSMVECSLDVDPQSSKFQLVPLPRAVETAITAGEADIGQRLREGLETEDIEVLYGVP